jgi:hypothetical protein
MHLHWIDIFRALKQAFDLIDGGPGLATGELIKSLHLALHVPFHFATEKQDTAGDLTRINGSVS